MPEFTDPPLTPGQEAIKEMADRVLDLKPATNPMTNYFVCTSMSPAEVAAQINETRLGQLLLTDGESLLDHETRTNIESERDLIVGEIQPEFVILRAWGWQDPKIRVDMETRELIEFPGESDWRRELDIVFQYTSKLEAAHQALKAQTGSEHAGNEPQIFRVIKDLGRQEIGSSNQGHGHHYLEDVVEADVLAFTAVCQQMFETRLP